MWLWPHTDEQYALLPVPARDADALAGAYYVTSTSRSAAALPWAEVG